MGLTLEVPPPLARELSLEAQREGLSPAEQATLLLHLSSVLLEVEKKTLFQEAVKTFIASQSLDAERVTAVFQELVRLCAAYHDSGKESESFQEHLLTEQSVNENHEVILRCWRSPDVHIQRAGRLNRTPRGLGKYAKTGVSSEAFANEKRGEIAQEEGPSE